MFNLENYETVEERLEKFHKDFPDFRIETQLVSAEHNRFIVQAWIYRTYADATPYSSGLAYEVISERGVNATSALENCETSAIGRALANAGYATKNKRPSREEMAKVARAKISEAKSETYIPVPNPEDPWTIKEVKPSEPAASAVEVVKEIIGAEVIGKDLPRCQHGEMKWRTGVSGKTNKPWGHFVCSNWVYGDTEAPGLCPMRWYEISKDGAWKPQAKRG